ncbi:MAG: hypothetical protein INR71_06465, partial [Terriglobus roseus]|nr:hypothetical protein [Terriglobus roseus]
MRAEADAVHVDTEHKAVAALDKELPPTPTQDERSPLADIDSNSVDGAAQEDLEEVKAPKRGKSGKGKKAKAGKKGGKAKEKDASVEESEMAEKASTGEEETAAAQLPQESNDDAPAEPDAKTRAPTYDDLEAAVTTPPARLTRSQRAMADELAKQDVKPHPWPESNMASEKPEQKSLVSEVLSPARTPSAVEAPRSPLNDVESVRSSIPDISSSVPQSSSQDPPVSQAPQSDQLARSALRSGDVSRSHTPSRALCLSPSVQVLDWDDPIESLDAMEDALEQVNKLMPKIDPTSPEKAKTTSSSVSVATKGTTTGATRASSATAKMTEAFKARKAAALGSTLAASKKPAVAPAGKSTAARPIAQSKHVRATSTILPKKDSAKQREGSAESSTAPNVTDYLASRRRPVSMHFPTPPPPAKSSKAPTRPTFALPGEAVAAKLKAAREERLKREEEEAQRRREFKARPVRNSMGPVAVKTTASSRARESLMHGADAANGNGNKENIGVKRSTSVRDPKADKRLSTGAVAAKRASVALPSQSASTTSAKRASVALPSQASSLSQPKTRTDPTAKRTSLIAANTSKSRAPSSTSSRALSASVSASASSAPGAPAAASSKASVTATDVVAQRQK